jgi:hypothetical protein
LGLASQEVIKCKEEAGTSHNCRNPASKGSNLSVGLSALGEMGHKSTALRAGERIQAIYEKSWAFELFKEAIAFT